MGPKPTTADTLRTLRDVRRIALLLRLPVLLDAGALLGAHRDGDFCDGDNDDVDLTTWGHEHLLPELVKEAVLDGFVLHHAWPRTNTTTMQVALKRDRVKIDIMCKAVTRHEGREVLYWTVYGMNNLVVPKSVPMDLVRGHRQISLHGDVWNVPAKLEEYLTHRYGDWRTPVHRRDYSCYRSCKCIIPQRLTIGP